MGERRGKGSRGSRERGEEHEGRKMAQPYVGNKFGEDDMKKVEEFEKRVDPNNPEHVNLLEEMKAYTKKLEEMRKHEDPRLSFSTPEFREAQRVFTENFKVLFQSMLPPSS